MQPIDPSRPDLATGLAHGPGGVAGNFGSSMDQAQVKASLDQLGESLSDMNLTKNLASVEKVHAQAVSLAKQLEGQGGYDRSREALGRLAEETKSPVSEQMATYNELGGNVLQTVQEDWSVAESNR